MADPYDTPHQPGMTPENPKDKAAQTAGLAADKASGVADHATTAAAQVKDTAAMHAADVRDHATAAGGDVVAQAKDEAGAVLDEAKTQGRRLANESFAELRTQLDEGQTKLAGLVRSLTDELDPMVKAGDNGPVTQLASTAQDLGDRAARWLETNDLDQVGRDVRRYAARNPWTFLAAAGAIGFVGARVARAVKESGDQPALGQQQRFAGRPAVAPDVLTTDPLDQATEDGMADHTAYGTQVPGEVPGQPTGMPPVQPNAWTEVNPR